MRDLAALHKPPVRPISPGQQAPAAAANLSVCPAQQSRHIATRAPERQEQGLTDRWIRESATPEHHLFRTTGEAVWTLWTGS